MANENEGNDSGLLSTGEEQTQEQTQPQQPQDDAVNEKQRQVQQPKQQADSLLASGDSDGEKAPAGSKGDNGIPEQFLNKDGTVNIDGLAKSYNDLRAEFNRRMNEGNFAKTPEDSGEYLEALKGEDGEIVRPEGTDRFRQLVSDDPALSAYADAAKAAGLSDKQFTSLLNEIMPRWNELLPEPLNLDAEREKLGKNAAALINANKAWAEGLQAQGLLTDEMLARAMELGRDATGVKLMQVLREQAGELAIPTGGGATVDVPMSQEEWYNMTLETHGKPGETFQQFMERKNTLGAQIFGDQPAGTSPAGLGVPNNSSASMARKKRS